MSLQKYNFIHFLSKLTNEPEILKYFEYTHKLTGYSNVTILEQKEISLKMISPK